MKKPQNREVKSPTQTDAAVPFVGQIQPSQVMVTVPEDVVQQPGTEHPLYEEPAVLAGCSQVAVLFPLPKSHFTE